MSTTSQMVFSLTENNQDFEWYPTTTTMIDAVKHWIPEDAKSILDIGAGDGRVLAGLADKCKYTTLYSIELSMILIQAQPENVIPIGTNLFEQNLACLPVDYIFCNPPYSQHEQWVCKIVSEGYAKKAFLVIPQRWKESKTIEQSLKLRGATTRIIHSGNFYNADRQAREVIDIVEIGFPKDKWNRETQDPFDIWFDQNIDTFEKEKEFKESETGEGLKKRYANSSIAEMVAAYQEEHELLENNYRAIFKLDYAILCELGVDKNHVREGLKKKMAGLKIKYWQILFDRLDAITSRLTTASKKRLLDKLTGNTSVEFTANNAYSVVLWAIKNANQYFDDQLVGLFRALATFEGVKNYKSNLKTWKKDNWRYSRWDFQKQATHYALDYRIVVEQCRAIFNLEYGQYDYPGNLNITCHNLIADVVAVMSNLGFSTNSQSSLVRSWEGGKWQNFYAANSEEILFQVKAYMNGNLHFRFMPEAIKALNIEAGRLLKWVRSKEDVVRELGYTQDDAEKYFKRNTHILPGSIKLLPSPTN